MVFGCSGKQLFAIALKVTVKLVRAIQKPDLASQKPEKAYNDPASILHFNYLYKKV
jgi:type III secretion system FlhB-like substrate exporter